MYIFDNIDVKELLCPYCGHKIDVPHDYLDYNKKQETQIIKCENCKMKFKAMVDFDPRFTTEGLESDYHLDDI